MPWHSLLRAVNKKATAGLGQATLNAVRRLHSGDMLLSESFPPCREDVSVCRSREIDRARDRTVRGKWQLHARGGAGPAHPLPGGPLPPRRRGLRPGACGPARPRRAMPSCAAVAMRWTSALARARSVATTAIVVFAGLSSLVRGAGARPGAGPRPPNSSSCSNGAAQNCGPSPTVACPTALTATKAPTVAPEGRTADADPSPPFSPAVVAPVPAPTLPSSMSELRAE